MISFFVALYKFIISEWLMHSRYSFYYFHWLTWNSFYGLANRIVLFMLIELAILLPLELINNEKSKIYVRTSMNFLFGALLLQVVNSASYQIYRQAPIYSALWILLCLKCRLKESLLSNSALICYYFCSK